jgi:hypothetical protein
VSFFYPDPTLDADESVRWRKRCQRSLRTAVPGTLVLTEQRLLFRPSLLAGVRRGLLAVVLRECLRAESVERTGTAYDGGTHRRVRITLEDGTEEMFVARGVDQMAEFLTAAFREAGSLGPSLAPAPILRPTSNRG